MIVVLALNFIVKITNDLVLAPMYHQNVPALRSVHSMAPKTYSPLRALGRFASCPQACLRGTDSMNPRTPMRIFLSLFYLNRSKKL